MKITFHGHSCFHIQGLDHSLLIDPFLTGNPLANIRPEEIDVDTILVTHGHNDHVGDTIQIAKQSGATVIAPYELATWFSWQGIESHGMAVGGGYDFSFGRVEHTLAHHGSGYIEEENKQIIYMGAPGGYLVHLDGKVVYHAGDTALFSDMKLLARKNIDVAFLPIGDNFTMGIEDAVQAAEWIRPGLVIPMHYNTFPVIEQDPCLYTQLLEHKGINGRVLTSGEYFTLC